MDFIEILKAILFGIVEGITEWLPISSTGHMIILDELAKLNVSDAFREMFLVVIQLGAILAVVVLYFKKLWPFSTKEKFFIKKDTFGMWFKILAACIPAAIVGVFFDDKINELFYNYQTVAAMLIIFGVLFIVIENYNKGVQITWQVYTPEEIAENSSLGMVQLYYFPAKTANAKYAIVVPGNGGNTTAELNEGASIANQLHELGYAAFVLRYRSFLNASDNAPLYDIANAIKYLTENADQFGVQRENYALMGFSSGGHIVGLIGSDNEKFGYKAFGLPQPAALLLGYPINDFFEVKPLYQLAIDPLVLGWRYYWTDISDVVNENFTPTYFFYGKNDLYMQRMCYSQQGPLLERKLRESGAVYECHVYENAPHAIGPGRHTDADGWIRQATAFWEKQCK